MELKRRETVQRKGIAINMKLQFETSKVKKRISQSQEEKEMNAVVHLNSLIMTNVERRFFLSLHVSFFLTHITNAIKFLRENLLKRND